MMVKICGITNRDDASAAVEAGADALGFNFWPESPRYVSKDLAAAIAAELPAGVLKVGVFVDRHSEETARFVGLDVVQIHAEDFPAPARPYWAAWAATTPHLAERMTMSTADAFVIDSPAGVERGGTGRTYDWSLAAGLPGRVILAGGLSADNVGRAVLAAKPWGVDACSRLESAPGKKDHKKIKEFVRAARLAGL
jgi:phosphoribosylanthranilate isomerase